MATYISYTPTTAIGRAMFNFDEFGVLNYKLNDTIRVSVSDDFSLSDYNGTAYSNFNPDIYTSGSEEVNWTSQMTSNVVEILNIYSQFVNVAFQYQGDFDTFTGGADFTPNPEDLGRFNLSDINIALISRTAASQRQAFAGISGGSSDNLVLGYSGGAGDIFINATAPKFDGDLTLDLNTRARQTLMHELGHSLGLSHPHRAYDPNTGIATITNDYAATQGLGFGQLGFHINGDSDMYKEYFTIMSYDDQQSLLPGSNVPFHAHTPMILDVIALQQAYGEGPGTSGSGNDTIFVGNAGYRTYFDKGGIDTIDLSTSYAEGAYLNMGVNIIGAAHLVGVAMSMNDAQTTIINGRDPAHLRWFYGEYENAVGGSFSDRLTGNALGNIINGLGGADVIDGAGGLDFLTGNLGADRFVLDAAALAGAQGGVFDHVTDYDQAGGAAFNAGEGDQLDVSAIVSAAFSHGSGQAAAALIRAVTSGTGAALQVDADGTGNGADWVTVAQLDGIHSGNAVNVILDSSLPGGTTIAVDGDGQASIPPSGGGSAFVASLLNVLHPADLNGDGTSDMLWLNDDGRVATWLMSNSQVSSAPTIGSAPVGWTFTGTGDMNGDGKDDLLWLNADGRVASWLVNGSAVSAAPTIGSAPAGWHFSGIADVNGNGTDDILWRNDDGRMATWLVSNGQVSSAPTIGSAPAGWHFAGTGDLNGDGRDDLLWLNDDGRVASWIVNGNAEVASAPTIGSAPAGWHFGGPADLNGDGRDDLLWLNDDGRVAAWLINANNQVASAPTIGSAPTGWHFAGTADVNGDHKTDILWGNDDGRLAAWLVDGDHVTAAPTLGSTPVGWHIGASHFDLL